MGKLVCEPTNPCVADERASQTKPTRVLDLHERRGKTCGFDVKSVVDW